VLGEKDNMQQKHYWITGIIVIILIGAILIIDYTASQKPEQYPCSQNETDYALGQMIVGFYTNVTQLQANALVESYGLTWKPNYGPRYTGDRLWGVVKVPFCEEQKWIDIFKKESTVRYAEFDYIVHLDQAIP
jgi:hypothetical protein